MPLRFDRNATCLRDRDKKGVLSHKRTLSVARGVKASPPMGSPLRLSTSAYLETTATGGLRLVQQGSFQHCVRLMIIR